MHFSWVSIRKRDIGALISHPITSSFHGMSRLMKPLFHLLRSLPCLHPPLISYLIWTVYLCQLALLSFTGASPSVGAATPVVLAPQAAASGATGSPRLGAAAPVGLYHKLLPAVPQVLP
jgi:hypothetical protein